MRWWRASWWKMKGPGIPPDNLESIFERFYTERPGETFGRNSGLGLSIARQIIEGAGGRIYAENRAPDNQQGAGARLIVELPASEPMSDPVNIHASCVAIGNKGVLLLGKSGAGKSDLALRLIDGGAKLVADDRTILFAKRRGAACPGARHHPGPSGDTGRGHRRIACSHARCGWRWRCVLGREGARLPKPQFYRIAPAPLRMNTKLPQIALDARYASTPAKIRAALDGFFA